MSQCRNILMSKSHMVPALLVGGFPVRCLRMFQSLPGPFMSRLMILFFVRFGRAEMGMCRQLMQLRGALMIVVVSAVVVRSVRVCRQ